MFFLQKIANGAGKSVRGLLGHPLRSRSLHPKILEKIAKKNNINSLSVKNIETVFKKISNKEKKVICVFGSLYQCGNVLNKN